MNTTKARLQSELNEIKAAGLFKAERVIESQQSAEIQVGGESVLTFVPTTILVWPIIPASSKLLKMDWLHGVLDLAQ